MDETGDQVWDAALARILPPMLSAADGESGKFLCHEQLQQKRLIL